MAYCEKSDILKLLPEEQLIRLTDDESAGVVDDARVQEAIDSAAEEIDSYIGARVALPLTVTVPMLGKLNVDLAIYNLYTRLAETIPETRKDRRDSAIKFLEKVNDGKISLGVQPLPEPPADGSYDNASRVTVRTKIFDTETLDKY